MLSAIDGDMYKQINFFNRRGGKCYEKESVVVFTSRDDMKVCLSTADKIFQEPRFKGRIKIGRRVLISKTKLDEYLKIRNQKVSWLE